MDGLQVGHFGFFRDPDLTQRIDDGNLYDQIDADGWVSVWFGGKTIFLPGFGEFNVYLTCEQTFFWDIVDQYGNQTKDGFEEMLVVYNPNMEPHTGDIIPVNPEEVFPNEYPIPRTICSNLWFYTNLFRDEYYRYNLIVLNRNVSPGGWPDEANAKIVPMNENVVLEEGDYIVGYRPKIEYMNQLAVMKKVKSGKDNAIMFKLKVDLDFLSENPDVIRRLRIFTQTNDKSKLLVYPENERDILWDTHNTRFMDEYNRYLLYHGIQAYQPTKAELSDAEKLYDSFMDVSNTVLKADEYNFIRLARDIDLYLNGESVEMIGFTKVVLPKFVEWVHENVREDVPSEVVDILRRVVLTTKYYKGFFKLDEYLGGLVGEFDELDNSVQIFDGNIDVVDGNLVIANGGENTDIETTPEINIIMVDGVRMFENGHIPDSAIGYRYPDEGSDYRYAGEIGSGLYKIMIGGRECDVFCEMEEEKVEKYYKRDTFMSDEYENNIDFEKEYSFDMRVVINGEAEEGKDFVYIYDSNGVMVSSFTGVIHEVVDVDGGGKVRFISNSDGSRILNIDIEEKIVEYDKAGWMYMVVSGSDLSYIGQFTNTTEIEDTMYYDQLRGIGWGKSDGVFRSLQFYNMPFNSVKMKVSGNYNDPEFGTGYLECFTGASGNIISFVDSDSSGEIGQSLIVDGEYIVSDDKTDLVAYDVRYYGDNDGVNNLLIKMRGDDGVPYCRRYVKMLAVR